MLDVPFLKSNLLSRKGVTFSQDKTRLKKKKWHFQKLLALWLSQDNSKYKKIAW